MREKTKILLIGFFSSHVVGSKVELLKSMGCEVHAFDVDNYDFAGNIYCADFFYNHKDSRLDSGFWDSSYSVKVKTFARSVLFNKEDEKILRIADRLIKMVDPDIVWGVWGPKALKWLKAVRQSGYVGKMLWTANVFPNRLKDLDGTSEDAMYRKWLHRIGGLVLTNKRMHEFMQLRYPRTRKSKILFMPDFFPRKWYARRVDVPTSTKPRVIYLGAPERFGAEIDRIDDVLLDIAENGVSVWCARPKETAANHTLVKYYDRFDDLSFVNGDFGQFANHFDAAIVMYNYEGDHPRFASTYPTRLFSALCGCIPIFVRKGPLLECEDLVQRNGIGDVFTDGSDLKRQLLNVEVMAKYRSNAAKNRDRFVSDDKHNKPLLHDFFSGLSD